MKPRRKMVQAMVVVIIGLAFLFQTGLAGAEKATVLRMAYPSADRGFAPEMIKWWGKRIEERTGGKVKVQYYWGGILGTSKEMLYSIEKGMCDVGVIFPMYFSTELPLATANTCVISTYENDPVITSRVWKKLVEEFPQIQAEWEAHNQKLLMGWEVGPYLWVSKKPIRKIRRSERVKDRCMGRQGPPPTGGRTGQHPAIHCLR